MFIYGGQNYIDLSVKTNDYHIIASSSFRQVGDRIPKVSKTLTKIKFNE
ncbi:MAG: hypothetical protein ACTSPW_06050 [Promethearchaeota archaeon]